MSRTNKDRPDKLREKLGKDIVLTNNLYGIFATTTKPKKKKNHDTEWHWMSTPSYWTRIMMNRPQRRQGKVWEIDVSKIQCKTEMVQTYPYIGTVPLLSQETEDAYNKETPSVSRKPHVYYW